MQRKQNHNKSLLISSLLCYNYFHKTSQTPYNSRLIHKLLLDPTNWTQWRFLYLVTRISVISDVNWVKKKKKNYLL